MASAKSSLPDSHLSFDDFFTQYYGLKQCPSIRRALLAPKQFCALINRYSTVNENLFPLEHYRRLDALCTTNMTVIKAIDSNGTVEIPRPIQNSHYPMCAASLLPILALDIQPNDQILDMCASLGGKSIVIVQNFNSNNHLTSNELSQERHVRLKQTLKSYLSPTIYQQQLHLTNIDGTRPHIWTKTFDKILIDAPCSSERHLIHSSSTHLWSVKRSKLNAKRQLALLHTAMRCIKPHLGTIVYSTCSLSPYENDQVIQQFLSQFSARVQVHRYIFPFGFPTEYGWMVLPKPWGSFLCLHFTCSIKCTDRC